MTTVTNRSFNPLVIAGTLIPVGATVEVPEFDSVKDSAPIKAFIKAEAISVGGSKKNDETPDERTSVIAELDKLGVDYDKRLSLEKLKGILSEASKK